MWTCRAILLAMQYVHEEYLFSRSTGNRRHPHFLLSFTIDFFAGTSLALVSSYSNQHQAISKQRLKARDGIHTVTSWAMTTRRYRRCTRVVDENARLCTFVKQSRYNLVRIFVKTSGRVPLGYTQIMSSRGAQCFCPASNLNVNEQIDVSHRGSEYCDPSSQYVPHSETLLDLKIGRTNTRLCLTPARARPGLSASVSHCIYSMYNPLDFGFCY